MIEKLFTHLLQRKKEYAEDILRHPPSSMEDLKYRIGRNDECLELIDLVEKIARGEEEE